ncbi:hypothetical protein BXY57_2078 [Thermoflavifilum aggregans]|uniref:Uncharacterized protein n=1 Tax=Thermoflavifilum aggregans TaxID=454188 RepID=A0A2M9CXC0_9BACT|nr:hypothetical protein BXY57_2078 [Thermoflavifilum aggregans]
MRSIKASISYDPIREKIYFLNNKAAWKVKAEIIFNEFPPKQVHDHDSE